MLEPAAVRTSGLGRIYKIRNRASGEARERVALAGVDLEVRRGELFGVLGPNGAGKTTLIKILTTLLTPTSGQAWVAGMDVVHQSRELRSRINMVSGGESSGYGLLTVEENLWMFGQFYGLDRETSRARLDGILASLSLDDRRHTKISDLSTGLRQKMNLARGFLTDPEILFLDEPTLGLDVGASRDVRAFVRGWMQDRNKTLLLTTHYMVEAEELCDRVAIIDGGRVRACDTPANLKRQLQQAVIYHLETTPSEGVANGALKDLPGVLQAVARPLEDRLRLELQLQSDAALPEVVSTLGRHGAHLLNLTKREATLEDVFVTLVGHGLEEPGGEP